MYCVVDLVVVGSVVVGADVGFALNQEPIFCEKSTLSRTSGKRVLVRTVRKLVEEGGAEGVMRFVYP
jgi:hypothetical protein